MRLDTINQLCPHKKICSGCSLLSLSYEEQLTKKNIIFTKTLSASTEFSKENFPKPLPIIPSTAPWGYRTSTKLVLSEDSFGHRKIGLFQKNSKRVSDIPQCPVHHPKINKIIRNIFGPDRDDTPAPFYRHDIKTFQAAKLKFLVIRYNHSEKNPSAGIILIHTGIDRTHLKEWSDRIDLSQISLYEATLHPQDHSLIIPRSVHHFAGEKLLKFGDTDTYTNLNPSVFFQANGPMTPHFIALVKDAFNKNSSKKERFLLDLYGGFGAYSFVMKGIFQHSWLVEAHPESIKAAQERQKRELWDALTPLAMSVEKLLDVPFPWAKVTDCIVNPPRSGLGKDISKRLAKKLTNIETFVYVSCNPATMVDDIETILKNSNLLVDSLQPIDMFPQTEHIECIAILKKPKHLQ